MTGNLVLSRKTKEVIVIDLRPFGLGLAEVSVSCIRGDKVRLALNAHESIKIHRKEVFEEIERIGEQRKGCGE